MMKKLRLISCILGLALCAGLFAACTQSDEADSDLSESNNAFVQAMEDRFGSAPQPDQGAESEPEPEGDPVTQEQAEQALRAYYPEGVELAFSGERSLHGKPAYVFEVTNPEGELVSRAAMTAATGEAWFYDMTYDIGLDEDWRDAAFYSLDEWTGEPEDSATYISHYEYLPPDGEGGQRGVSLNNLPGLPEFPAPNWITAFHNPEAQELNIVLSKITGSVTGAPDGPAVSITASLVSGQPVPVSHESTPAPAYSNPRQVLGSGELLALDEARMADLARYLYEIIKACEAEYPDATGNVEFESLEGLV
ncbi:hypothetical protein LJC60_00420 [Ruminococcaceae bacterium OttesenSCG-928-D13]|nr:hypothetical protein [Ruminococcaceae bacterium OttesenSCG-928-D13]